MMRGDFFVAQFLGQLMSQSFGHSTRVDKNERGLMEKDLLGDAIYANVLLLGAAWQAGMVPISAEAIRKAIDLNGAAVTTRSPPITASPRSPPISAPFASPPARPTR